MCIFVNSDNTAFDLNQNLQNQNITTECILSKVNYTERVATISKFKDSGSKIIIITENFDLFFLSKRFDIVINYDMPNSVKYFLARVHLVTYFSRYAVPILKVWLLVLYQMMMNQSFWMKLKKNTKSIFLSSQRLLIPLHIVFDIFIFSVSLGFCLLFFADY